MDRRDAEITADVLVTTDTWGTFTHGTKQIRGLMKNYRDNRMQKKAMPELVTEGSGWARYDGHQCMPMVSSTRAMETAIRKAKVTGIAMSIVRNSGHYGAAGYYANMAAERGLIGMSFTNVDPIMAVPGARVPVLGSNPVSYAVPAGEEHPVMLDIATSVVAGSKVFAARDSKQSIPLGWLVDKDGVPTTDPSEFNATGALMPMAGHKGYGIALFVEILTGILSGGAFGKAVTSWVLPLSEPVNQSHSFIAIDVEMFMPLDVFRKRMDALIREIRDAPRAKGADRIFLPGEMEWERRERALKEGIAMPDHVMRRLEELAADYGMDIADIFV
jgi:ureidoglycolate dehydrogenase (NAD+)